MRALPATDTPPRLREVERARQHIRGCRSDERDDDDRKRHLLREIEHRQPEHVEADVVAKNRIGNAEGNRRDGTAASRIHSPLAARLIIERQ